MDSKQKKFLVFSISLIILLFIVITFILILNIKNKYNQKIYEYVNETMKLVSEKYSESETDIIQKIINNTGDNHNVRDNRQSIDNNINNNHENTIDNNISTNNSNINITNNNILKKYGITPDNLTESNIFNIDKEIIYIIITIISTIILIIVIIAINNKYQNKKIREIDNYCREILKGNYEIHLEEEKEGTLSILRDDIYKMTIKLREKNTQLEKNNKDTEKLIQDISHQLKTPLTSLNLINDILAEEVTTKKGKEFLQSSANELEKINWLIKTLLNIAKLDSKTLILTKEENNCYTLLEEVKTNLNSIAKIHNCKIEIKSKKTEKIICDKKWTKEAISNIVKNAIEHDAKNITLEVLENKLYTQINIKDDGEGIDKNDLGHIFERFYKSKNSKQDSLGLGLAFSKSIILNQAGDIKVKSTQEKRNRGTTFFIKLYKS